MRRCLAILALLLAPLAARAQPAAAWGAVAGPTDGPPHIIGGTSLGCIAGARALPLEGQGWQVVRVSRNRYYGHPALLAAIAGLAAGARAQGMGDLWIGDLGQPRGGPLRYGHASHQTGLDVDVWLDLGPKPLLPAARREAIEVPSLVLPGGMAVDPARWTPRHAQLIRLAATLPGVDRVLVNPAIKQALCRAHRGEAWLRRVRPWWGHDEHLHLRLACPAGQPDCQGQPPPPAGDGCDSTLDWWFSEEARHPPRRTGPPPPPPVLPAACRGVLAR
jgi:penicillin-insensitive murein endopeptidase